MGCKGDEERERGKCCRGWALTVRIILYIFGLAGIALSIVVIFSCEFLSYQNTIPVENIPAESVLPLPFTGIAQATLGLFRWQDVDDSGSDTCNAYSDPQFDGMFKAARACGFLAFIFMIVALIISTIELCCFKVCCSRFFIGFFAACAFISQACTFLIFGAEKFCIGDVRNCSMENGGIYSAVASGCYLVSVFLPCCGPKPKPWVKSCREKRKAKKQQQKEDDAVVAAAAVPVEPKGDEEEGEMKEAYESDEEPAQLPEIDTEPTKTPDPRLTQSTPY